MFLMDAITIKETNVAENYELISGFMLHLHKHEHQLFDKTAQWADIETSYMRHIITMQAESGGVCLVAYKDGLPAGFIFGFEEEQDDSRFEINEGKELYVSDGYIADAFRRQGIYRKLNDELEKHFINKGILRITRLTHISNTRMRHLLEEEGYIATRVVYEKWL